MTNLPPRPDEMTPDKEVSTLNTLHRPSSPLQPPRPGFMAESGVAGPELTQQSFYQNRSGSSSSSSISSASSTSTISHAGSISTPSFANVTIAELIKLHANFDKRLQPFWARNVTHGRVRISLYTTNSTTGQVDKQSGPIDSVEVDLDNNTGYFGHLFRLDWEKVCEHPGGVYIAYGDHAMEHQLTVVTEYIPQSSPLPSSSNLRALQTPGSKTAQSTGLGSGNNSPTSSAFNLPLIPSSLQPSASTTAQAQLTLDLSSGFSSFSPKSPGGAQPGIPAVRVISDIDDTIKISGILHGVRAVFRNVFVRPLEELGVPGMPEWYQRMKERGVRFHYVVRTLLVFISR